MAFLHQGLGEMGAGDEATRARPGAVESRGRPASASRWTIRRFRFPFAGAACPDVQETFVEGSTNKPSRCSSRSMKRQLSSMPGTRRTGVRDWQARKRQACNSVVIRQASAAGLPRPQFHQPLRVSVPSLKAEWV